MAIARKVDYIPKQNTFDSMTKISNDDNNIPINSIIINLLNLFDMEEGTNMMYPTYGLKNIIMSIPYSEDIDSISERLQNSVEEMMNRAINFTIKKNENSNNIWNLFFNIEGYIGKGSVKIVHKNNYVKIIDPKYIMM